jgi:hypothetical protein
MEDLRADLCLHSLFMSSVEAILFELLDLEDEGRTMFRNMDKYLQIDTALRTRRLEILVIHL